MGPRETVRLAVSARGQTGCMAFAFNGAMPDPQSRIKRYQERAEECMSVAEMVADPLTRAQYMRVAETYLRLIEMELRSAASGAPIKPGQS